MKAVSKKIILYIFIYITYFILLFVLITIYGSPFPTELNKQANKIKKAILREKSQICNFFLFHGQNKTKIELQDRNSEFWAILRKKKKLFHGGNNLLQLYVYHFQESTN